MQPKQSTWKQGRNQARITDEITLNINEEEIEGVIFKGDQVGELLMGLKVRIISEKEKDEYF